MPSYAESLRLTLEKERDQYPEPLYSMLLCIIINQVNLEHCMDKETAKKIEELERRIRDLEARPTYVPYPVYPQIPSPTYPTYPWYPTITWGGGTASTPTSTTYQIVC